jgi:hypothetical protein
MKVQYARKEGNVTGVSKITCIGEHELEACCMLFRISSSPSVRGAMLLGCSGKMGARLQAFTLGQ